LLIGYSCNKTVRIERIEGKALPYIRGMSYLQLNNIRYNKYLDDYITLDTTKSHYSFISATKKAKYEIEGLPEGLNFVSFCKYP